MASDLDLRGEWIPLITPFAADGSVDVDAIERLCREYLAAGCAGIVALGTTGDSAALEADVKRLVIDTCARCDAVWLDFGELRQIADAPGRDRGSRNVPRSSPRMSTPADRLSTQDFWDELLG